MFTKLLIAMLPLIPIVYVASQLLAGGAQGPAFTPEGGKRPVATVTVVHAKPAEPKETLTLPGNIVAWYQTPVYAQVSGYVKAWYKDYGAEVKKGDVLAEISTPSLDAETNEARASMASERAQYDLAALTAKRYEAMRATSAVSDQSISVAEAKESAEEAQLRASQNNVYNFEAQQRFKTIVAPYDGVVIARKINVGDYVNKEGNVSEGHNVANLFTLADVQRMRLFVSVPERFGPVLEAGLTADVVVPQHLNRHFEAKFLTVSRGFDPQTRTAVAEFTLENPDRDLWPGSFASVTIVGETGRARLLIPGTALVFQEHGAQVATVSPEHTVHFKSIDIAVLRDDVVEVASGLNSKDLVIDTPSAALLEGDPVRVAKPSIKTAAAD